MFKNKIIYLLSFAILIVGISCKKQLQVGNPNQPTLSGNVNNEAGIIAYTQGSTYIDGFVNGDGWLGDSYFSLPYGYSELLADVVGADAANQQISVVSVPDKVTMGDGTVIPNGTPHIGFLRTYNTRANTGAGANVYYYQWLNMYALNNACNSILAIVDNIPFSGDKTTKANTVKAWCYWWKGYAYSSIGSMYYSGLIIDSFNLVTTESITNNNYVLNDSILAHSNFYFNLAENVLSSGVSSDDDYKTMLGQLIPSGFQTGHGGVPSKEEWVRNINTMLARNLLVNKLNPFVNGKLNSTIQKSTTTPMSVSDWNTVLNYAKNGIQKGDIVFTGRAYATNAIFSPLGGTVSALTAGTNSNTTFKITERFMQNFKSGDKRVSNNFVTYPNSIDLDPHDTAYSYYNPNFSTRWNMLDRSTFNNLNNGVYVYGALNAGDYELYMAGSYEENALMLAEANIMLGNTDAGLAFVDAIRDYQGAAVTHVAGTGLTQTEAMQELVQERRVALAFRGLSFYDSRRWGWIYAIANGGGSYGNTFLSASGVLDHNTTIDYNFLDYWDVPADESVLNPPGSGSAATVNPNF
ncbi:MAG TPA: RagB/SusD family nutrient uptake outer membrane protein [Puia sp.]|nr:RagB/SusD family nutrient uptake outer membrane protein [Puia sp.]